MPLHIVPDYIVYDELKRERQRQSQDHRPRLEVPKYIPLWSDEDNSGSEYDEEPEKQERGEVIISMF